MKLDREDIPKHHLRERFFDKPEPRPLDAFTVFVAVLAAILVAFFLRATYNEWQVRRAVLAFQEQVAVTQKHHQDRIEASRKARAEKIYQQKMAKYRAEKQKQAAISAGIKERNMKAKAWEDFYKPLAGCESSNDDKNLLICGNDYAKAKKKFEALWASKKLRQRY